MSDIRIAAATALSGGANPGGVRRAPVADTDRQTEGTRGNLPPQQQPEKPTAEAVSQAVSFVEDYVSSHSRNLEFHVDDDIGKTVVTVLDTETGEVIRRIPSEEFIASARYIAENLDLAPAGVLVNTER